MKIGIKINDSCEAAFDLSLVSKANFILAPSHLALENVGGLNLYSMKEVLPIETKTFTITSNSIVSIFSESERRVPHFTKNKKEEIARTYTRLINGVAYDRKILVFVDGKKVSSTFVNEGFGYIVNAEWSSEKKTYSLICCSKSDDCNLSHASVFSFDVKSALDIFIL